MLQKVQLCHDYAFPAQTVWHVATDLDHLKTVTEGLLAFRDLPSGTISEGQTLDDPFFLPVSFGALPAGG